MSVHLSGLSKAKHISSNMGIFGSSEENVEEKNIDSAGHVNNNIVIQEAKDTHSQLIVNEKLLYASYALVFFELIKLGMYVFTGYRRRLKKAYQNNEQREK